MTYLRESQLYKAILVEKNYFKNITNFSGVSSKYVFLSHSHKDKNLVFGLLEYFESLGVEMYVDWQDSEMPRVTSSETAKLIKDKIKRCEYFIYLATINGINSKWTPWELGIADSFIGEKNIGIIPVRNDDGIFIGNEYLDVYRTIEIAESQDLAVFSPGNTKGQSIKNWFR